MSVTLLMKLVTHVDAFSRCPRLWSDPGRSHRVASLHLSVLLARPQFKGSLSCRINDGAFRMISQLLLFISEWRIVWYSMQSHPANLFEFWEETHVCSPLLCFYWSQTKQNAVFVQQPPPELHLYTVKKYSSWCLALCAKRVCDENIFYQG